MRPEEACQSGKKGDGKQGDTRHADAQKIRKLQKEVEDLKQEVSTLTTLNRELQDSLRSKILQAGKHNLGFSTLELLPATELSSFVVPLMILMVVGVAYKLQGVHLPLNLSSSVISRTCH